MEIYEVTDFYRNYQSSELYMTECGKETCTTTKYNAPTNRKGYVMHYVVHGRGHFIKNGVSYKPSKNDIFLIAPNDYVEYYPDKDDPWTYYWIGFAGERSEEIMKRSVFEKSATVRIYDTSVLELFAAAVDNYNSCGILNYESLGYLYIILSRLTSTKGAQKQAPSIREQHIREAIAYMNFNIDNSVTIADLARSLKLSPTYVINMFTDVLGISPKQYLINFRLEKSIDFLLAGEKVSEVYKKVGFSTPEQYAKSFKKKYGKSPKAYVRSLSEGSANGGK